MAAVAVDNPALDATDVTVDVSAAEEEQRCHMNDLLEKAFKEPSPAVVDNVVDLAKTVGMPKMVQWGLLGGMDTAARHKKKWAGRLGAAQLFEGLCTGLGVAAAPFMTTEAVGVLPFLLSGDRHKAVRPAGEAALNAFRTLLRSGPPSAAVASLPAVVASLAEDESVGTKVSALRWLAELAEFAPMQLSQHLTYLVPLLSEVLQDMSDKVTEAAETAAEMAFATVDNRDVAPFVGDLVAALRDPAAVPECIHRLASLTFVATVETPALALVVPLLSRGLNIRTTAVKRQCAVISNNMSKLVENPVDAAPFLPKILPLLEKAADNVSDPEARGVCGKARDQLKRIQAAADAAKPPITQAAVLEQLQAAVGETASRALGQQLSYVSVLCYTLCTIKVFDETAWDQCVVPFVTGDAAGVEADAMTEGAAKEASDAVRKACAVLAAVGDEEEEEDDDLEDVCDTIFTMAYGTKILLHNTRLNLKKGARYGLLGPNQSGKSTLLRSIANGSLEGFPPADELKCVFVEADIQGETSHLSCAEYVFADPAIKAAGIPMEEISRVMLSVGFTEKMLGDPVTTLSGGWRMKLALSRAMLQKADVLLLDEPANHLDVINVAWVEDYLCSLKDVTCVMVSHHAGLLDKCCTHMMNIANLKLTTEKGNLSAYAARHPEAKEFFEIVEDEAEAFSFPQPGPLEGVKSRGRALMKMTNVEFTYPGNEKPTLAEVTVQVSLNSRVACVGVNGAGKSTLVKILTGEREPSKGTAWIHPQARIAFVQQHAFASIEKHLDMTGTQYIMWRFANGEDKEARKKDAFTLTEAEAKKAKEPITVDVAVNGVTKKLKRVVKKLEDRRPVRHGKDYEYEVSFVDCSHEQNMWMEGDRLNRLGFGKHVKAMDARCLAREGMYKRPLTTSNIEKHAKCIGLEPEVMTHTRMSALSDGEKVKVVLAACTWNQPHIIILDEPTNFIDRKSLGALSQAIKNYEGGILMITHNDSFCSALCPERWVVEGGKCDCQGDVEWMKNQLSGDKVNFTAMETMVDAAGNESSVAKKKVLSRKEKKRLEKRRKAAAARGEVLSDDEEFWATGGAGGM